MLEYKDVLYIVLAFCALWFTAFLCWFLWQIAIVVKRINDVLSEMKSAITRVEQALIGIKGRFEHGTSHLGKMSDHVKQAVSKFASKLGEDEE